MKKILVVDDEKDICDLFRRILESAGYQVSTANSGEEALEIIRQESFSLLFLDLNLPGIDGIELCRRARKLLPISIFIAVTGYASMFHLHDCREAGFDDYYIKPVGIKHLLKAAENAFATIDRWLSREE